MSGASRNPALRHGSFASRKARGEQGGTAASNSKEKAHGFDARHYHQNANTRGIHALRTFDCPVCDSRNTIRVDLNPRMREGTVRCTYCMSLRPTPEDLPYPYSTSFIPSLENKADVFFKFNEMYNALLQKQMEGDAVAAPSPSSQKEGRSGGNSVSVVGARKRPRDSDDADGRSGDVDQGEADGLLSGLAFDSADPDALDNGVPGAFEGVALGEGCVENQGVCEDGEGETEEAEVTAEEVEGHPEDKPVQADMEDDFTGAGVDDVDIAEFFEDSD